MSGTDPLILIIDDELATRRLLRAVLTSQGYRLAQAVAGRAGLAQAATLRPDLIILDLGLPEIDGLHVIEQLREWASTPVIVLTARSQERAKIAALDGGPTITSPNRLASASCWRGCGWRCVKRPVPDWCRMSRPSPSAICVSIWRGAKCQSTAPQSI